MDVLTEDRCRADSKPSHMSGGTTSMKDDLIEVYCDGRGVTYCSTRDRLIRAGLATPDMFPEPTEAWRGNGPFRSPDEPLWSIQKAPRNRYKVLWSLCLSSSMED